MQAGRVLRRREYENIVLTNRKLHMATCNCSDNTWTLQKQMMTTNSFLRMPKLSPAQETSPAPNLDPNDTKWKRTSSMI